MQENVIFAKILQCQEAEECKERPTINSATDDPATEVHNIDNYPLRKRLLACYEFWSIHLP